MVTAQSFPIHTLARLEELEQRLGREGDAQEAHDDLDPSERPTLPSIPVGPREDKRDDASRDRETRGATPSDALIRPRYASGPRLREVQGPVAFATPDRAFFAQEHDGWQERTSPHDRPTPVVDAKADVTHDDAVREWWLMQRRDGLARWVVFAIALCTALSVAAFVAPLAH